MGSQTFILRLLQTFSQNGSTSPLAGVHNVRTKGGNQKAPPPYVKFSPIIHTEQESFLFHI